MDLKITLKNHYVAIGHAIFVFIGLFIALVYLNFHPTFIFAFLIWFIVTEGLGIYLHIEYWLRNRGEEYYIEGRILTKIKDGKTEEFTSEEIHEIVIYMSPNMYKKWPLYFFAMEQYHYARVFLKNGERLYITCLLAPRVGKALSNLKGVKIERRKWLFNSTYIPKSWY